MVVRMRHTKSARNQRRSHHALGEAAFSRCPRCNIEVAPHTVCKNCGHYRGAQIIDVLAKLNKKEKKKKEKELHAHESTEGAKKKDLSAEELSHR